MAYSEIIHKSKLQSYENELKNITWTAELESKNPEQILSLIHNKLDQIKNKYLKKVTIKLRQHTLPWAKVDIIKLLKEKCMRKYQDKD